MAAGLQIILCDAQNCHPASRSGRCPIIPVVYCFWWNWILTKEEAEKKCAVWHYWLLLLLSFFSLLLFLLLLQWCSSARTRVSICFYFLALLLLRTFFSLKFLSFSVVSSELKHQRNWSALRGTKNHRKVNTSLLWSGESLKAWQSWNYIDTHLIPKMSKIALSLFKVNLIHTKRDWGGT